MSATPPSIAIEALVLGGPEVVRVVLNSSSTERAGRPELNTLSRELAAALGKTRGNHSSHAPSRPPGVFQ